MGTYESWEALEKARYEAFYRTKTANELRLKQDLKAQIEAAILKHHNQKLAEIHARIVQQSELVEDIQPTPEEDELSTDDKQARIARAKKALGIK